MRVVVTAEQEELRAMVRRFLADRSPGTEVRRLMETPEGYDPAVWARLSGELGLPGLAIPEEYGGAGYRMREQAVVLEEMGRALVCAPYLSSAVLAATTLLGCADEAARGELLPAIAAGTAIVTLACPADGTVAARRDGPGWTLTGGAPLVLDGGVADHVLVVAGSALFVVDGSAAGLTRTPLTTLDQTRRLAHLDFSATPARPIGPADGPLARTLDVAAVAIAAEQLGGAQRVLEMSVEYARLRHQFGRPIGSFQAIKHKCADILMQVESSRSAVLHAATAADLDPEALPVLAGLARSYCSETYLHAAAETIQIHGGIGFTWEHDAHLHYKRAKSSELLLGSPAQHRARLADLIGL